MKPKIIIILNLSTLLLVSSCFNEKVSYSELTEVSKRLIPYKLEQIVNFIDLESQSFDMTIIDDIIYSEWVDDYTNIQYRRVRMKQDSQNIYIELSIGGDGFLTINNIIPFDFNFVLYFNNKGNFLSDYTYYYGYQYFYSRKEINNMLYYDVVENINNYLYSENGIEHRTSRSILYNKTYGILQVKDKGVVLFSINH